jgi:hypothetical protein
LGNFFHAFGRKLKLWQSEIQIAFGAQWNQVDVRVGNFKSKDGHPNTVAGNNSLDAFSHFIGERPKCLKILLRKVKQFVDFYLRHYEGVTFGEWAYVQKRNAVLTLCHLVAGYIASDYFAENGGHPTGA